MVVGDPESTFTQVNADSIMTYTAVGAPGNYIAIQAQQGSIYINREGIGHAWFAVDNDGDPTVNGQKIAVQP